MSYGPSGGLGALGDCPPVPWLGAPYFPDWTWDVLQSRRPTVAGFTGTDKYSKMAIAGWLGMARPYLSLTSGGLTPMARARGLIANSPAAFYASPMKGSNSTRNAEEMAVWAEGAGFGKWLQAGKTGGGYKRDTGHYGPVRPRHLREWIRSGIYLDSPEFKAWAVDGPGASYGPFPSRGGVFYDSHPGDWTSCELDESGIYQPETDPPPPEPPDEPESEPGVFTDPYPEEEPEPDPGSTAPLPSGEEPEPEPDPDPGGNGEPGDFPADEPVGDGPPPPPGAEPAPGTDGNGEPTGDGTDAAPVAPTGLNTLALVGGGALLLFLATREER